MKLVKLFNKLSAVALAASLVVGFASCSTTTDDPFNPNAPLTLEEYVKSEIKKAIENGGAQAKPEDPSELEFESRTSLMDKIQLNNEKTEDAWGNGTKISSANPLQASEGYGWDKENGQISLPFAYDAGYFGENTHIIIEADDSALNYNADAAIKIEFKVENPSTGHSNEMNITSKFKDGVAIIPISEIGFTDSCQFLLTFRAKGTVTIKNIDMAKAKGQSAPEPTPTPGEEEKPGKPSGSGSLKEPKSLEFHVNANSTNAENTMIFVKYDRSAYGAEEEVKVTDAELNLYINDKKVKTFNEIVFVLDEYGAEITSRGPIEDPKAMKEYKAKLSVGKAVTSGETVKIELVKASVVKVGAASDKITLANLQFALIDTDPSVDYYKELAPNAEQFQNICTLEDLTTGEDTESKPGEEQKPSENPTPTPDEKPEPGKTPGEEYEAGNSTVTSIKLVKNEYAEGGALQTQVKIQSGLKSRLVGDKVKVAFKGTADRKIGKVELMIVDTTETASWWTALSETKKDTFSTEINFEFVFEITKAPIGTGADSMVFAINGLDSDEAATITCTSFSIEKNADKKPAGGEDPEPTPDPKPEDSGLLSKAADLDWGTPVSVAGSSFASATDDSSIKITYVSNADNDYHKFKMMCGDGNENELFEGEATGFTIDTTSDNKDELHGCAFTDEPSETPVVITYKPSPAEWTKIKDGEFRLIGHGAKITKIELGTAAPGGEEGGDSVVFDDAISSVVLSPNNWNGKDNGIQYHVANASLFPAGIEAGDKYKFEMTGSITDGPITQKFIIVIDNGDYNPNKVQNYFVNDPSVSGKSAEECLSEGITVTMTFDAAIESSKVVLWIYTEGPGTDYDAETTASKTATIDFSSFKITKVE